MSAAWDIPRVYRVARRRRDTALVSTLELVPDVPTAEPGFEPGQFNMVYAFGIGEVPLSISGDPEAPGTLAHTVKNVGPVSGNLCRLRPGALVGVRGPFGAGWPVELMAGGDVLVVAGGVGLAPLRPALYRLMAERERHGRVVLVYGSRTPSDILFGPQLRRWRRQGLELHLTVDRGAPGWRGHVGMVTQVLPYAAPPSANSVALVCGPEIMMRFAAGALERLGMDGHRIFLSMERNMKCAQGLCGHCQFGLEFVCKDGPVFSYDRVRRLLATREV